MQASMSRSFFVVAGHIGLLTPLGSIKPVAPSAPCVIVLDLENDILLHVVPRLCEKIEKGTISRLVS